MKSPNNALPEHVYCPLPLGDEHIGPSNVPEFSNFASENVVSTQHDTCLCGGTVTSSECTRSNCKRNRMDFEDVSQMGLRKKTRCHRDLQVMPSVAVDENESSCDLLHQADVPASVVSQCVDNVSPADAFVNTLSHAGGPITLDFEAGLIRHINTIDEEGIQWSGDAIFQFQTPHLSPTATFDAAGSSGKRQRAPPDDVSGQRPSQRRRRGIVNHTAASPIRETQCPQSDGGSSQRPPIQQPVPVSPTTPSDGSYRFGPTHPSDAQGHSPVRGASTRAPPVQRAPSAHAHVTCQSREAGSSSTLPRTGFYFSNFWSLLYAYTFVYQFRIPTHESSVLLEGPPEEYKKFRVCNCVCSHCHALFWYEERLSSSTRRSGPLYHRCCMGGKVRNEVANRLANFGKNASNILRPQVVQGLIELLDRHNALVQLFRTARDKLLEKDIPDFKIRLFGVVGSAQHELPTADQIVAIVFEGGPDSATDFDVVIQRHSGEPERFNKLQPTYMSLHFSLLFIFGKHGYHPDLKLLAAPGSVSEGRKRMSMDAYYAYLLHDRFNRYALSLPFNYYLKAIDLFTILDLVYERRGSNQWGCSKQC
ncbi:DNA helicase Pif1-like protein [Artemisia annua]|uniref:DNA helicase Pif1-like protein n=1 Tax=Artemisia annua TaxID=35608 RepID=A0A2U1M255_ARTAN|nr:DNA helicase Pif1-like protein [Artemisia annua]